MYIPQIHCSIIDPNLIPFLGMGSGARQIAAPPRATGGSSADPKRLERQPRASAAGQGIDGMVEKWVISLVVSWKRMGLTNKKGILAANIGTSWDI
jgi:hypothetical protein